MLKLLMSTALCVAAYGAVARPGTINYTEGKVTVDGQPVTVQQIGSIEVEAGHVLETDQGKAEMLLTPGVFFRLDNGSSVRMLSPSLTDTHVELLRGRATLEVDLLEKENRLVVRDGGVDVRIEKKGIYTFDAGMPRVSVYAGQAIVQIDDHTVEVGKGKELRLTNSAKLKPQKFDRNAPDELYAWSKLRSEYVADANASSAQMVVMDNPGWWAGTGWYWNPWYSSWAFLPGSGYFYNPWGFGFYSPAYWSYGFPGYYSRPGRIWRGGVGRPVPGRGVVGRPAAVGGSGVRFGGVGRSAAPAFRSAPMGGGGHFGGGGGRR